MIFCFTFHDEGGRAVERFFCSAHWYDEAYEKAEQAASLCSAHGIQHCDSKGKPEDLNRFPHLVRYLKPEIMAPFGVPNGWDIAKTDCCVQQFGSCGVLIRNKATGMFAIFNSRAISEVNQKYAQWAANNQ